MRFLPLLVACGLLFLSAAAAPLPADTAALQVSRLPANGLLLKQGWRYQVGDNPQWARSDFDDSGWETINPTRPRRELPAALGKGISWLRLRFRLSDTLRQQQLVMDARLLGACDIYLNGRLLSRQGTLTANPAQVQPQKVEPVMLPMGALVEQVLAVRYAPSLSLLRGSSYRPHLAVWLSSPQQYWQGETTRKSAVLPFFALVGVSALLTLLHLAFFRYNPAQRANLYFAGYAFSVFLGASTYYYFSVSDISASVAGTSILTLARVLGVMSGMWSMRALYALFNVRPGRLYATFWVGYGGLVLLLGLAPYHPIALLAMLVFGLLITAEQLRLTIRAVRRGQRGAGIIGAGFAGELLAGFACIGVILMPPYSSLLLNLLLVMTSVLRALGISLFLAREFALDSQLLQVKLGEVERLSAQTLAQEQDKQALLAQQNETLEQQVTQRTSELQRSLTDLRATQAQLIQKEKMASLGELTAGIAHEIQNPLNFVNNFSEVSTELMAELEEAQAAGDAAEASALAADVRQNLIKITHHGRRAAGIVRGMLEHSRTSAGERQPTDLNRLTEEYLRLAYQGQRASDKTFNATLHTEFAADLAPVDMVGADVGRVLLNLFNNAFYAVQKRQQRGEAGYQPTVRVETQRVNGQVNIRVQDNGTGIPAEVQAKILQPFFTTKPTGEGTGLGLSLSHDIIAQGHGGTLTVESQLGRGTTFIISLPR